MGVQMATADSIEVTSDIRASEQACLTHVRAHQQSLCRTALAASADG